MVIRAGGEPVFRFGVLVGMADLKKRVAENVPGDFFVDTSCINCGNCRVVAGEIFGDMGPYAFVRAQPKDEAERRRGLQALLACPTASIGAARSAELGAREVVEDFPLRIEDSVYYAGFNSEKSYGGASYFVRHPAGNWLIDSPRFVPALVKKLESLGGLRYIFLTHQDDVADAEAYARHFGAERIIHEADGRAAPGAEILLKGVEPVTLVPGFTIIPVPGHTRGHCVLLHADKFLFTGDHLEWESVENRRGAFRD
jgi:ferredoxin